MVETWFASRCDGEWEHVAGLTISTLDNPGWRVAADVASEVRDRVKPIKRERDENDWLHAWIEGETLNIACGPRNLRAALDLLREVHEPGG